MRAEACPSVQAGIILPSVFAYFLGNAKSMSLPGLRAREIGNLFCPRSVLSPIAEVILKNAAIGVLVGENTNHGHNSGHQSHKKSHFAILSKNIKYLLLNNKY
jgi:hypothetical protein